MGVTEEQADEIVQKSNATEQTAIEKAVEKAVKDALKEVESNSSNSEAQLQALQQEIEAIKAEKDNIVNGFSREKRLNAIKKALTDGEYKAKKEAIDDIIAQIDIDSLNEDEDGNIDAAPVIKNLAEKKSYFFDAASKECGGNAPKNPRIESFQPGDGNTFEPKPGSIGARLAQKASPGLFTQ